MGAGKSSPVFQRVYREPLWATLGARLADTRFPVDRQRSVELQSFTRGGVGVVFATPAIRISPTTPLPTQPLTTLLQTDTHCYVPSHCVPKVCEPGRKQSYALFLSHLVFSSTTLCEFVHVLRSHCVLQRRC
eukprot:gene7438-biopygen19559